MELYFSLASYAEWGSNPHFPQKFFAELNSPSHRPGYFDDRDPPRRVYRGDEEDVHFWMARATPERSRWLFLRKKTKSLKYSMTVRWVDMASEPMRSRGDYNLLYATVLTNDEQSVVSLWKVLCQRLRAFHGFLDRTDRYNLRAHRVLSDGSIERTMGGYLQQLPGFFAHNYFGRTYASLFDVETVREVLGDRAITPKDGFFLSSPSGLHADSTPEEPYKAEEIALIQRLGEKFFHLPWDSGGLKVAPTLDELRMSS